MPSPNTITLNRRLHTALPTHSFTLYWTSLGSPSSPPLVFIHGTPWSSITWHPFALSLSRHFHVYLFDNPGFGSSPLGTPLPNPTTAITPTITLDADLSLQSAAAAALVQSWTDDENEGWAGRPPHIIAHDHAGLMALRMHLLHATPLASLCLIDVVAIGPFGTPLFAHVAANEHVFTQLTGPVFEGVVESYIRDAAHTTLPTETMEALKRPWIATQEGREGFVRQMCQANSRNIPAEVLGRYAEVGEKVPVCVIWGKEDKWIPVETAWRLAKALGARETVVLEGAGHLVMYDQPGRLGTELGLWLGRVGRE